MMRWTLLCLCWVCLFPSVARATADTISLGVGTPSSHDYLTDKDLIDIKARNVLHGIGSATYSFSTAKEGWWSLWVRGGDWPTDLYLDGTKILHVPFGNSVWPPKKGMVKIVNFDLKAGSHKLTFSRPWFPGLPFITRIELRSSQTVEGSVRFIPRASYASYREGSSVKGELIARRFGSAYTLRVKVQDSTRGKVIADRVIDVPAGKGNLSREIDIPTNKPGPMVLKVLDGIGNPVARNFEYVVVDTAGGAVAKQPVSRELIQDIKATQVRPAYASGDTHVRKLGNVPYLESGEKGEYQNRGHGDYFSYVLHLPTTQDLYEIKIYYPDDKQRTFTTSIVEQYSYPYALDAGVAAGGNYPVSGEIKSLSMYFYPRQKNPRLLFLSWQNGQPAAVSEIKVYKIKGSLPPLTVNPAGRKYALYFEEALRYPAYFGSMPTGNTWRNLLRPLERYAEWTRYIGADQWQQAVNAYQAIIWPSQTLIGYGPDDEEGIGHGFLGPPAPGGINQKDIVRLMLLVGEEYGIGVVPEIQLQPTEILMEALDRKFGGSGNIADNSSKKPWLVVDKDGKVGGRKPDQPYFNPVYPGVQDWILSVVKELVHRYGDSKAFDGVAFRLMPWVFSSWQAFPSLSWGYGDFTISEFEKDTGITVPVSSKTSDRFERRYEWLTENAYGKWVRWRAQKITAFYQKVAAVISTAKPGAKLYVNSFSPIYEYSTVMGNIPKYLAMRFSKGWLKLILETGIDPVQLSKDPNIVFSEAMTYPAGIRWRHPMISIVPRELYRIGLDTTPIVASEKITKSGSTSANRFNNEYMETNFALSKIGIKPRDKRHTLLRICGVINPPGREILRRYAHAMKAGNLTFLSDGGLGYILGQPKYLREFAEAYDSLPPVPMKAVKVNDDRVGVWSGTSGKERASYVVNDSSKNIDVLLRFRSVNGKLRTSSGGTLTTDKNGRATLRLKPFELLALFDNSIANEILGATVQLAK